MPMKRVVLPLKPSECQIIHLAGEMGVHHSHATEFPVLSQVSGAKRSVTKVQR